MDVHKHCAQHIYLLQTKAGNKLLDDALSIRNKLFHFPIELFVITDHLNQLLVMNLL